MDQSSKATTLSYCLKSFYYWSHSWKKS